MDLPIYLFETLVILIFLILLMYRRNPFDFWKTRGIPYCKPPIPLLGNIETLTQPVDKLSKKQQNMFPGEKFYGSFICWKPILIVKDPELIERILIKDFPYFYNRNYHMWSDTNELTDHLGNRVNEEWRTLRYQLTTVFSTGKLRGMHTDMVKCADKLTLYLSRFENNDEIEVKDLCGRYAMEVIASCGFGMHPDFINKKEQKLYEILKQIFLPHVFVKVFFMLQPILKSFYRAVRIDLLPKRLKKDIMATIDELWEFRKAKNVQRPDIFHQLMKLKKRDDELIENKKLECNDPRVFGRNALYSNSFMFLTAAYESIGSTISNVLYELAINQDIQNNLYEEVSMKLLESGGKFDFYTMKKMVYLDQVISETLRKYPPGVAVDRSVTKEYTIPQTDIVLPPGTLITVPIYGMHHDPQYFPDPEKFNPERFDPKMNLLTKGTYLPFGDGPRSCIAIRFAKVEIKICVVSLVRVFKIHPSPKTKIPMEFETKTFMLSAKDGHWLTFEKRVEASLE